MKAILHLMLADREEVRMHGLNVDWSGFNCTLSDNT